MWILNSLCFLTSSKHCEDLQGRKFLLDVRTVSRKDCLSAFLCTTALIKECFLEVLGKDAVKTHVKEYLCSEITMPDISFWARRERLVWLKGSSPILLCAEQMTQISWEIKDFLFSCQIQEMSLFEFLSFQYCLSASVELQFSGQTPKGCALADRPDVLWRN